MSVSTKLHFDHVTKCDKDDIVVEFNYCEITKIYIY